MAIDCNNPKNSQEQNLCSCKKATDTMASALEKYTTDYTAYTDYVTARNAAIQKYDRWKNMSGEYSNWATRKQELTDEKKTWNNCVLWTGIFNHDDWCQGDTGFAKQTGANQHGCALGSGKGECQRNDSQVNEQLRREGYNAAEPSIPSERQVPQFTSNTNILCCSQIFNDISVQGGAADFSNINQNCQQRITNELNYSPPAPASPPPTVSPPAPASPPPTVSPTPPESLPTAPESPPETEADNKTVFIIAIIIMLFIISMSGLLGLTFAS
jgi:hypothetical protein